MVVKTVLKDDYATLIFDEIEVKNEQELFQLKNKLEKSFKKMFPSNKLRVSYMKESETEDNSIGIIYHIINHHESTK